MALDRTTITGQNPRTPGEPNVLAATCRVEDYVRSVAFLFPAPNARRLHTAKPGLVHDYFSSSCHTYGGHRQAFTLCCFYCYLLTRSDHEDPNYPASQFYLGFFAGITVEADNVEIDLNRHTLAQNKEFYLLQRFWNAIELANRVFVDNEGVSSLNFQEGDKEQFQSGRVPATRGARKVHIHDGTLGLSSHSGVHGNNASQVYIENVKVRDWEVSGIHLNGCRRCTVKGCEVGPTSSQVPARATFSNARFLELYTSRLESTTLHLYINIG